MSRHMDLGHIPAHHNPSFWRARSKELSSRIRACAPQIRSHKLRLGPGPGVKRLAIDPSALDMYAFLCWAAYCRHSPATRSPTLEDVRPPQGGVQPQEKAACGFVAPAYISLAQGEKKGPNLPLNGSRVLCGEPSHRKAGSNCGGKGRGWVSVS